MADINTQHKYITLSNLSDFLQNLRTYLRTYFKADDSNFGGIKLGYTKDDIENKYPVQLNDDGKAFVQVPSNEKVKQNKITIGSSVDTPQSFPILTGAVGQDKTITGETYFAPNLKLVIGTNPNDFSETLDLTGLTKIHSTEFIENRTSLKDKYAAVKADDSNFGGIKLGYTKVDAEKKYPVQLNNAGKAFVQVPWEAGSAIKIQIEKILQGSDDKYVYEEPLKADTAIYLDSENSKGNSIAMDEITIPKFVDSNDEEINTKTGENDPRVITFSLIYRSKNTTTKSTQLKFPNNVDIKWANGYRLWNGVDGAAVSGIVELVITCIPQLSLYTASWIQYPS